MTMFCELCLMPRPFPDRYTLNHQAQNDGSVAFECSRDSAVWPWLRLNATHPILVQTINFWASIDSGEFLGTFNPDTWTALTHVRWICGAPDVGLPHRNRELVTHKPNADFEMRVPVGRDPPAQQTVCIGREGNPVYCQKAG